MNRFPIASISSVLLAVVLVCTACASAGDESSVEVDVSTTVAAETSTTIEETETSEPAELPVEWFESVAMAIGTFHEDRSDALALFGATWVPGPRGFDAQLSLFEADGAAAERLLAELPGLSRVALVDGAYGGLREATSALGSDADRIAQELRELESELRASLEESAGRGVADEEMQGVIGAHDDRLEEWTRSCFGLQASTGDDAVPPIDCIGVERSFADLGTAVDPSLVTVSVDCVRGTGLSTLPFETSAFSWFALTPADAHWIRSVVTIENRSDRHVQLDPGFRVQYLDERAELIAERDWTESFPPAFHAAPGQTVHRTGYAFEGVTFNLNPRGDTTLDELLDNVFTRLDACEVTSEPVLRGFDANPHLDPRFEPMVDVACAELDPEGFFTADVTTTAPEDEDLWLEIGIEYVDADGNRQGMGGSRAGPMRVSAGESDTVVGDSVSYTIADPSAVTDCVLHSVLPCPDECGPRN